MKAKGKIALAAIVVVIVAALFGAAFTDKLYFATLHLDQGEVVENPDGSVLTPFYLYKDAWGKYQANILNITFGSERINEQLVQVNLDIVTDARYSLDSLRLEFYIHNVYSAIRFKDPSTGEGLPYEYELSGDDSTAVLDFPSFAGKPGEKIAIRFWLDLSAVGGSIADGPVLYGFSMHEHSVLKMVRHTAKQQSIQFVVPD